jgi:hypothetical protein
LPKEVQASGVVVFFRCNMAAIANGSIDSDASGTDGPNR